MRNMSKKTWKLRVWNHMTEMQKLDILLKHAKVPHTYGRRWPEMDRPDNQEVLPGGRHDGGEQIIAYVAVKVRLLGFDVPQSSVTKEALQNTASEMEWRLNVEHDHPEE